MERGEEVLEERIVLPEEVRLGDASRIEGGEHDARLLFNAAGKGVSCCIMRPEPSWSYMVLVLPSAMVFVC